MRRKTCEKKKKSINKPSNKPNGEPLSTDGFTARRTGDCPERVTPLSSAIYFASCHAAISTAEP